MMLPPTTTSSATTSPSELLGNQCHQCSYLSLSALDLELHCKSEHSPATHEPITSSCKAKPSSNRIQRPSHKQWLQFHQSTHGKLGLEKGRQLFTCDMCDFSDFSQHNLDLHMGLKHHGGPCHQCNMCDFSAKDAASLETHKQSLHGVIRFSCNQCNNFHAKSLALLNAHKLDHERAGD